jgi:hypothetical protein
MRGKGFFATSNILELTHWYLLLLFKCDNLRVYDVFLTFLLLDIRWTTTSKTQAQGIKLASCVREVTVSDFG